MRELPALVGRHLRVIVRRGRGARLLGIAVVAAFLPALVLRSGPASALWAATVLLGGVLLGVGAASGQRLPGDRDAGRAAWLATLAPRAFLHRLAPAVAGMIACVVLGLVGALLVLLALAGGPPSVHRTAPLASLGGRHAFDSTLPVPLDTRGRTLLLELEVARRDGLTLPLDLAWQAGEAKGERHASPGPLRFDVPPAASDLVLENRTKGSGLVVLSARWIGAPASFAGSVLVVGLVLGFLGAAVAPVSVLVSRFTSAPTAVAAGYALGLLALARPWLIGLVPPGAPAFQTLALGFVEAFARLAPDVGLVAWAGEPAAGRAVGLGDVLLDSAFAHLLLYGLVVLFLLALPAPRRLGGERRS